jgi:hypothetical protein
MCDLLDVGRVCFLDDRCAVFCIVDSGFEVEDYNYVLRSGAERSRAVRGEKRNKRGGFDAARAKAPTTCAQYHTVLCGRGSGWTLRGAARHRRRRSVPRCQKGVVQVGGRSYRAREIGPVRVVGSVSDGGSDVEVFGGAREVCVGVISRFTVIAKCLL